MVKVNEQEEPAGEPQAVDARMVEVLEQALLNALAGDLLGVAIVQLHGSYTDGTHVGTVWAGSAGDDLFRLLGGIEVLKSRILKTLES